MSKSYKELITEARESANNSGNLILQICQLDRFEGLYKVNPARLSDEALDDLSNILIKLDEIRQDIDDFINEK